MVSDQRPDITKNEKKKAKKDKKMRQQRVYINYNKWSDNALATLSGRVATFMAGNANFPTPAIAVEDYAAVADDFRVKLQAAIENGGKLAITAKNNARTALLEAMRLLAFYVNTESAGDSHKLTSSGFVLVVQPQALRRPHPPLLVRLQDGAHNGELQLIYEPIANAWEYEYTIAHELDETGEPVWGAIQNTTNTRDNTISGLTEGVRYYARVRSRNGKGVSDWSQTASRMAR